MNLKAGPYDLKPGWMVLSLLLHTVVVLLFSTAGLYRSALQETPTYYVDIVSLPVAEPAPGRGPTTPSPAVVEKAAPPPSTGQPPATRPAMALPSKTPAQALKTQPPPQTETGSADQEAREFRERLSRLEHRAEARHQSAALESLQRKVAASAKGGAPSAVGTTAGSDYGAYIQSRLRDALVTTIVYRSKQPEAAVRLYIDKRGKLVRYVMERPSTDKLFNDSVLRAIEKARPSFPPTPNGNDFEKLYIFSPQEVSNK